MLTDNIYMNMIRKSFKTHEKYIKSMKYNAFGYIKELFGTQCLLDIVFNDNKIQVLTEISDISVVDKTNIPGQILNILHMKAEWEWMDDYFKDIID